jgi:hypothetical protein
MNPADLKVNDRIRIVSLPVKVGQEGYQIHDDTLRSYRALIKRRRSVRIARIDDWGMPWFAFKLRRKNGAWESHYMGVAIDDQNWVKVVRKKF